MTHRSLRALVTCPCGKDCLHGTRSLLLLEALGLDNTVDSKPEVK